MQVIHPAIVPNAMAGQFIRLRSLKTFTRMCPESQKEAMQSGTHNKATGKPPKRSWVQYLS